MIDQNSHEMNRFSCSNLLNNIPLPKKGDGMKRIIFSGIILLLIGFFALLFFLSTIPYKDVYFYKTAKFCSSATKQLMKSPSSYKELKLSLMYKKESDDKLREKIADQDYFKDSYENGKLSLYRLISFVDYEAKNGFGVDLKNSSICYFDSILIIDYHFMTPNFDKMAISNKIYSDIDLMISTENFNSSLLDISKISIFDKISYLINKNNFRYYEN